jgi:hypothetical protein
MQNHPLCPQRPSGSWDHLFATLNQTYFLVKSPYDKNSGKAFTVLSKIKHSCEVLSNKKKEIPHMGVIGSSKGNNKNKKPNEEENNNNNKIIETPSSDVFLSPRSLLLF